MNDFQIINKSNHLGISIENYKISFLLLSSDKFGKSIEFS